MKNIKLRLTVMNFLEFAVWGAYLTSMGTYLATHGMATNIGWFYSIQGIVSSLRRWDIAQVLRTIRVTLTEEARVCARSALSTISLRTS